MNGAELPGNVVIQIQPSSSSSSRHLKPVESPAILEEKSAEQPNIEANQDPPDEELDDFFASL